MDFSFTEEQLMFKDQVIRFAKKEISPRAQEHDLKEEFDLQSFRKLGAFGILGLHFPEELGGSDADVVTSVLAGEALGEAGVDGGLTLSYGAHTFLCADTIFAHGNEEQRKNVVRTANLLRQRGFNTETYHEPVKLSRQLRYASKKGIPYVWFPPLDENESHQVKDMTSRAQVSSNPETWAPSHNM